MSETTQGEMASLRLNAAVDGELDALAMAQFERDCADDPALAERHESLRALRDAARTHAATQRAPESLRRRVAEALEQEQGFPQ